MRRDGFWEGIASGAALLTTTYGSPDRESILPQWTVWAQSAHQSSPVVFAALYMRMNLFCEVTFQYQAKDDKHLYGNTNLAILEEPWPGGTTRDLLARMEQDVSLTGNAYIWKPPGEDRLVRLRPDWTTIVSELVPVPGGGQYRDIKGYWVEPPKNIFNQGKGQMYPADEVVHWHPIPDPAADFRGMSWLTPVFRDVKGDDGMAQYKIKYLENGATPNLLIKYPQKLQPSTVDNIRERVHARYAGPGNAFKTLVLDQGADLTVVGNTFAQMDFTNVMSVGAERILAAAAIPPILIGLESIKGAGRSYQEVVQQFANMWARPQWRSVCAALEDLVEPPAGARLWFDVGDIAALQDTELNRGQAALVRGQALLTCRQAGATLDSAVAFIESGDITQIQLDPNAGPVPNQVGANVQHMLGQQQPGVTATPLPANSNGRLPLPSVSPGDGGNNTRPTPQLSAGRR